MPIPDETSGPSRRTGNFAIRSHPDPGWSVTVQARLWPLPPRARGLAAQNRRWGAEVRSPSHVDGRAAQAQGPDLAGPSARSGPPCADRGTRPTTCRGINLAGRGWSRWVSTAVRAHLPSCYAMLTVRSPLTVSRSAPITGRVGPNEALSGSRTCALPPRAVVRPGLNARRAVLRSAFATHRAGGAVDHGSNPQPTLHSACSGFSSPS